MPPACNITMASRRFNALSIPQTITRVQRPAFRHAFPRSRGYADAVQSAKPEKSHTHAIVGGLAGGGLVFLAGYGWYHFSGAKTAMNAFHRVKATLDSTTKKVSESAPEPNEALKWLRSTTQSYATFIPGAKYYVDKAFDDLDAVHERHASEVDEIVKNTYNQLKSITKNKGMSLEAGGEVMSVLSETMNKIMGLAGDAAEDIMNNHPGLKERVGGDITKLKQMGEQYGPEAKKQVDETWAQISSLLSKGLSASTIPEIKKLIEEKTEAVKKFGNEAFDKGLEQAKPYLDKVPQAKELIEKNKDALKQGDIGTLIQKLKDAASSGNADGLKDYVDSAVNKAKDAAGGSGSGGGFEKYLAMIPGGGEIGGKLQKLQEIGQKHGKEAEQLLNETVQEIQQVLQKKVAAAEDLASKASKDASK